MNNGWPALGRLERVDPRAVWPNEAHDFTPWLLANGDRLADALGIELELTARKHAVGGYSLDLLGRDLAHDAVLIVENQLADSDHGHLGQLLTYAAGTGAATIVWIAPRFPGRTRRARRRARCARPGPGRAATPVGDPPRRERDRPGARRARWRVRKSTLAMPPGRAARARRVETAA